MTTNLDDQMNATVSIPVHLLQYIDQECIIDNADDAAREAFNAALDAAFPDGPPGGCGGYISWDTREPAPAASRSLVSLPVCDGGDGELTRHPPRPMERRVITQFAGADLVYKFSAPIGIWQCPAGCGWFQPDGGPEAWTAAIRSAERIEYQGVVPDPQAD